MDITNTKLQLVYTMIKLNYSASLGGFLILAVMSLGFAPSVYASGDEFALCAKNYPDDSAARLKCYDQAAAPLALPPNGHDKYVAPDDETRHARSPQPIPPPQAGEGGNELLPEFHVKASVAQSENIKLLPTRPDDKSYLSDAWKLDDTESNYPNMLGHLIPHRQSYIILRKTNRVNNLPSSPAAGNSTLKSIDLDTTENKYQFSFKADIGNMKEVNIWGLKTLRVWGAYTQQSNWQMLNGRNSSPFRETDYSPELIASFATEKPSGLKLINLGFVHQSNGQNMPSSRSWNRIYLQGGWEWGNISVLGRGWWRIPENILTDDNPDITDYVGQGDMIARWEPVDKSQAVALLLRNNLSLPNNRGFVQLDWSLPVAAGNFARLHAQLTSGFGESLIDYNHRQTTLGLGFSFSEW